MLKSLDTELASAPVKEEDMVYQHVLNGTQVTTGDVIFTKDGTNSIYSLGYKVLGRLIPGEVDHCVLYVGPGGLCVEAGIHGVITFDAGNNWVSDEMFKERGLMDTFFGASSVLEGKQLDNDKEEAIRNFVRAYALGCVGKPYNINFLDPDNERTLYCSQLVYLAYKQVGINLNVGLSGQSGKWYDKVVFPAEILEGTTRLKTIY